MKLNPYTESGMILGLGGRGIHSKRHDHLKKWALPFAPEAGLNAKAEMPLCFKKTMWLSAL
jgi:hypothetical protein